MEIEMVYPPKKRYRNVWEGFRRVFKWIFLTAAYICPLVNLCVGGEPWSLVVLWSEWLVWSQFFSPSLVEYNLISQISKGLTNTCVLLLLIATIYSLGWAEFVIPIVCFGTLATIGVLFLTDISKHKQNMMPMVWIIFASLVGIAGAFIGWPRMNWPMIVLGATAFALLTVCAVILRRDMLSELKKRFHIK